MPAVYAQDKNTFSLGIYPPLLEINVNPPANVKADMQIQNLSELPQNLKIVLRSFRPAESSDGTLEIINESAIDPQGSLFFQKVKLYEGDTPLESITLGPYESRTLSLRLAIESDSPIRDYYFSVIFLSQESSSFDTSHSQIQGGIGTNVILSVGPADGGVKGEVKEFSAPTFLTAGPVPFTLLVDNKSDRYIIPTGRISILDMFGREAGLVNIEPQYILANSSRFLIDSDQASPSADLQGQIERLSNENPILIWPKTFIFGLYTAQAHIKLSENGPIFETKTRFLALPLYVIFVISLVIFVSAGIYLKVRKKI